MTSISTLLRRVVKQRTVQSGLVGHSRNLSQSQTFRTHWLLGNKKHIGMADVKEIVNAKIAGKKVVIFSKSFCPFCTKAKKAFQELMKEGVLSEQDYDVMEIENNPKCDEIQNYLNTLTGGRSVPRVFINGKFLGGGDDTVRMKQSGELKTLLG